jgi:Permeases of the major facilitator superfamily
LFLFAFFLYIDGVHTIMSLAAIFAENIGMDQSAIIVALILVQFVAFPSTLFWSYIGNKYDDKVVLYATILIYICVVIYSTALTNSSEFYVMAVLIGSVQGGIQAASRSFFSKIIPTNKSGEFFGFYNTFGRAGSVMGPALVGMFIGIFNNLQIALVPIIVLFIAGGFLLRYVKYPNEII